MKPSIPPLAAASLFVLAVASTAAAQEGKPLQRAEITAIVNEVRVVKPQTSPQPAQINEVIRPNEGVLTGPRSRAELLFSDRTLARLGANTQFTFIPGTRTTEVQQGTMLLQVPKGAGGAQVKTAAVTAAVTGTTILIEFFPGLSVKIIVLEGTLRVSLTNRLGESLLLTPGKMLIMKPDATRLPDPVDVDLKKLIKTSKLIVGMGDSEELSNDLIDQEVANQQQQKKKGTLLDTNLIILGAGTDAFLTDLELLAAIENAIDGRLLTFGPDSGGSGNNNNPTPPTPPAPPAPPAPPPPPTSLTTITNPNPFPLDSNTVVSTNPTITNSFGTFQGATYTTTGSGDMTFLFGSTSPTDALLQADDDNPPTTLAAFRFSNLDVIGNPTITTTNGPPNLALISENNLTFAPGTYTFTGLNELFFGAGNSINVPAGTIFSNPALELTFYARNPGSNLTFLGTANTETLDFLAANDLIFGPGASFSGLGFSGDVLGSIFINPSTINASSFLDLIANGSIFVDAGASLSTSFAFLEAGNQITLTGSSLTATGLADLAAPTLNLSGTFSSPLSLFAQAGGVTGFPILSDLRSLTTTLNGSVFAGFIGSAAPPSTLWGVSGELFSSTGINAPNVSISADGINFNSGTFQAQDVTLFGLNSTLGLQGSGTINAGNIVALSLPVLSGTGNINATGIFAGSVTANAGSIFVTNNLFATNLNAASNVTVGGALTVGNAITVTGNSTVSANSMNLGAIQTSNPTDDINYVATSQITVSSVGGPGSVSLDAPTLNLQNNFNSSQVLDLISGASTLNTINIGGDLTLDGPAADFTPYTVNASGDIFNSTTNTATFYFATATGNINLDILQGWIFPTVLTAGPTGSVSFNLANFNGDSINTAGRSLTVNSPVTVLGNGTFPIINLSANGWNAPSGFGGIGGNFLLDATTITAPSGFNPFIASVNGGNSANGNGGAGGSANLSATGDFEIVTTATVSARGGNGSGTSADGGNGGFIVVSSGGTFSTAGLFFQLDATGGSGTNAGGQGGTITVSGTNAVELGANSNLYASSFGGGTGPGGNAGTISILSNGHITIGNDSVVHSFGGDSSGTSEKGGDGGMIQFSSTTGDIILGTSADVAARGGSNPSGLGGAGGSISMTATNGSIEFLANNTISAANGTGSITNGTGGTVNLTAQEIKVGSVTSSTIESNGLAPAASGGAINLNALRPTGPAITVTNSSQLLALANLAGANGGQINLTSAGGDLNITNNSSLTASGGSTNKSQIQLLNNGPTGLININNSTLTADILKVGALGPAGQVIISNGATLSASDTLRIYGGSGSGTVIFTGPGVITLTGGGNAYISASTVQIDSGTTVNNTALVSTTVNANTHNYNTVGFGSFDAPPTPLFDPNTRPPF